VKRLSARLWRHVAAQWQPEPGSSLHDFALMQGRVQGIYTLA
jgi:hypothetical protein